MWKQDRPQASVDIFGNHFIPFPGGKCSEWRHNMRHPECTGAEGRRGYPWVQGGLRSIPLNKNNRNPKTFLFQIDSFIQQLYHHVPSHHFLLRLIPASCAGRGEGKSATGGLDTRACERAGGTPPCGGSMGSCPPLCFTLLKDVTNSAVLGSSKTRTAALNAYSHLWIVSHALQWERNHVSIPQPWN